MVLIEKIKNLPGLVVNASRAWFIDDSVSGVLVHHLFQLRNRNVRTALVVEPNCEAHMHYWLHLSKLDTIFETYEDGARAINSYSENNET